LAAGFFGSLVEARATGMAQMWDYQVEQINHHDGQKYRLLKGKEPVSYSHVLTLWQADQSFRDFFVKLLAGSPYPAFRWEAPPITKATQDRSFEFVVLKSDSLDHQVDSKAFAEQFGSANGKDVLTFPNLGGDP
jgi:uncharacterized protein DUF6940